MFAFVAKEIDIGLHGRCKWKASISTTQRILSSQGNLVARILSRFKKISPRTHFNYTKNPGLLLLSVEVLSDQCNRITAYPRISMETTSLLRPLPRIFNKHAHIKCYESKRFAVSRPSTLPCQGRSLTCKFEKTFGNFRLFASQDTDGPLPVSIPNSNTNAMPELETIETHIAKWTPPRYLWRGMSVFILAGQVITRTLMGKIHKRNTLQQLERIGPKSVGVCLLTAAFVGMAFTIQFVREFTRLGLNRAVGGVLALAFSRELSPVVTAVVVAGRIGSAFAAELGTMQVSEQTDTLRVLGADPVDYLVTPRVIACCVALPILTLMCFTIGMASSALLADGVYGVSINIILDSAQRALRPWDIISAMIKSHVFGGIIAIVSCAWGVTTLGGAKGVGESTTSAVVISLVSIFVADFLLSCVFFQGAGDSLKSMN
ncbi:hypothetical protein MRB53_026813 [Persea americana]|uniref:Uncharacterized protein n=1 Tax=Persea americana TaxID=3435 RepID=A0ACC2LJ30_PERAE|nr:hypothetical protein MRB53_026813 [Persea americana]